MKQQIEELLKNIEDIKTQFKNWCKDKTVSLDERWELFIKSDLGTIDGFYREPPGIDWNKKTLYDDFYTDKYAVLTAKGMLEIINDKPEKFDWNNEKEIEFKESFLQDFCKGFENDW